MHVVGSVVVVAIILMGMASGGSLSIFWNPPSVVWTLVGGQAALYSIYGKDSFSVFSPGFAEAQPERAQRIAQQGGRVFVLVGWVGMFVGIIQILHSGLDDLQVIAPASGIMLLTGFYGYVMHWLVWLPLSSHLAEKAAEKASS